MMPTGSQMKEGARRVWDIWLILLIVLVVNVATFYSMRLFRPRSMPERELRQAMQKIYIIDTTTTETGKAVIRIEAQLRVLDVRVDSITTDTN